MERYQHAAHAQSGGELARMHPRRPAKRDQRVVAWIVSALDRDPADGAFHACVHHPYDALSGVLRGETELTRKAPQRAARALGMQWHAAAEERVGQQPAEHEIGVGDRWQLTAAVACRTGI